MPEPVVSTVFTDSPLNEMWSHLGRFEVIRRVRDEFRVSDESAEAAGDCVRQARELFRSAHDSPLLTRPILLYYGMVSLSKLFLLLDGKRNLTMAEIEAYEKQGHGLKQGDPEADAEYALENSTIRFLTDGRRQNPAPRGMFLQLAERVSPGAAAAWGDQTIQLSDLLCYVPQLDALARDLLVSHRGYLGTFRFRRQGDNDGNMFFWLKYFSAESEPCNVDEAAKRLSYISPADFRVVSQTDYPDIPMTKYSLLYRDTLAPPPVAREEFATFSQVYPPAFYGVRFESLLAEYVLMYALSIVARYKPHRWARILEGRESPLLPIIERLMWVCERWWPNMVLNRLTGQEVCFTQPALAAPEPGGSP